ncbi:MAG: Trk system potassium transporter TrkA [Proteobacteria bacterium]|nr:Trk system potassium transporter TrkA [Pseudomonadota bacterium]
MESRNILIVGAGQVGRTLAQRLSGDGHDVTLVEDDAGKAQELHDGLDVQVVEGNGSTAAVLREAGVESASLVVASTDSDEINMLVGLMAAQLFQVPHVVVRVRDPRHESGFAQLVAAQSAEHVTVNPNTAAVDRIATLLEVPGALDVVSFMGGALLVAGFKIRTDSDFAGLRVSDMQLLFASTPTLAVAIHRDDDWIIPHGSEEIRAGDLVYFAIARHELQDVLSLVGVPKDKRHRVLVAGASRIGLELARRLESLDVRVLVIEEDAERAQHAGEELKNAVVLHGLVTDQTLLENEEIEGVSTFVAVTPDHETNLVAGLLAKRLGVGRAVVLVDNPALVAMVGEVGIDAIISPRSLTIGLTLHHIRGEGVRSGAALLEDQVEIVEVEAVRGSRLTSGPLSEVKLPRGVLVGAIRRGSELLVPRGRDQVAPGDRVLLVTTVDLAPKLGDFTEAP